MAIVGLRNLCTPAYIYLVISLISIIIMSIQNFGNTDLYCLGSLTCSVSSVVLIFIIKMIYIFFWTWILNIICKNGSEPIAWFLLLLPFILAILMIFYFML